MPVSSRTQWLIVLLAGLSWPFLYAVKLGQVGPILYLLFAAGWRGIRSRSCSASAARWAPRSRSSPA